MKISLKDECPHFTELTVINVDKPLPSNVLSRWPWPPQHRFRESFVETFRDEVTAHNMQGYSLKASLLASQRQQRPSRVGSKQVSAPLRRYTRRHRVAGPVCYGGFENASLDIPRVVTLVGQLASAAAWITAAFLGYKLVLEQVGGT